jgi:hypothetical protein
MTSKSLYLGPGRNSYSTLCIKNGRKDIMCPKEYIDIFSSNTNHSNISTKMRWAQIASASGSQGKTTFGNQRTNYRPIINELGHTEGQPGGSKGHLRNKF